MRFSDVVFLDADLIEEVHGQGLLSAGGAAGIRDRGLLESAAATPTQTFDGVPLYSTLATMAAALAFAIARNHPFVDGNKRAALFSAVAFLEANGFPVDLESEANFWRDVMLAVAAGTMPRIN